MDPLIDNIQKYGTLFSFMYILILHWNEFERFILKKNNSLLEKIEIGLLPASTINKFGISATILIVIISASIATFVFSISSKLYIFFIFFILVMILLGTLFL
ncbi:MAG: hypothetical protein WBV27_13260, partial [Trichococcus sp.]|uniref:hypothetical protein n=1 Tax=Trichococcus sp. TaxID=1985464 RepID=UPI003C50CF79